MSTDSPNQSASPPGTAKGQGSTDIRDHVTRHVSFLRATAIGGIFFLLPLLVICFLLGQVAQVIYSVAVAIQPNIPSWLPINEPTGIALIVSIAVLIIVLACFVAGILASRSIAQRFIRWVEKYLLMLFPRYAIFKEQLSGNIGGDISKNTLRPVRIAMQDHSLIAFEVERAIPELVGDIAVQHEATVTLYVPGSPDPWSGQVIHVQADRVTPLDASVPDVLGAFEKLGVDSQRLMCGLPPT
ncbi:MAG: DUF502 domain-containing protein [Planctomycetota bacterium]